MENKLNSINDYIKIMFFNKNTSENALSFSRDSEYVNNILNNIVYDKDEVKEENENVDNSKFDIEELSNE